MGGRRGLTFMLSLEFSTQRLFSGCGRPFWRLNETLAWPNAKYLCGNDLHLVLQTHKGLSKNNRTLCSEYILTFDTMGACCSADGASNKEINKQMEAEKRNNTIVHKLLLLGAGESGKSTLFKQMEVCYRDVSCMKAILRNCKEHGQDVAENLQEIKQQVLDLKADTQVDSKVGPLIKVLWADPGIRQTFLNKSKFQIFDNADYYFDKIDEISQPGYLPNNDDIFRARVRTTGIVETEFEIDQNHFRMFDVGGQRNERKKWIHCFELVTAVIFVAAISEYDMVLYEDPNTNRVVEALHLFGEVCNSRWFKKTSKVLFLNKRDLFVKKIENVPLSKYFPEYRGPQEVDASLAFLKKTFEDQATRGGSRVKVYTHVTCATNTENTKSVFTSVKDIVIRRSLTEAGLSA
eukprot:g23281.t1